MPRCQFDASVLVYIVGDLEAHTQKCTHEQAMKICCCLQSVEVSFNAHHDHARSQYRLITYMQRFKAVNLIPEC